MLQIRRTTPSVFVFRSSIKESSDNQSKLSDYNLQATRSPTGEPGIHSGELEEEEDEEDDLYSSIDPNDILDLPPVRHVDAERCNRSLHLFDTLDRNNWSNSSTIVRSACSAENYSSI